jgi:CxxC motif-containing protein (DUF1111 family)
MAMIDTTANPTVSNTPLNTFSDYAVHSMGTGLADQVSQGNANGTQFRTAPLWGVGQRVFFLHDGRTNDLMQAIQQHASSGSVRVATIIDGLALAMIDGEVGLGGS